MDFFKCRICGNSEGNAKYYLKEMMFGSREEFEYIKCVNCGCLQIREIPKNIGKYYPNNYYSFNNKQSYLRKYVSLKRDQYLINNDSLIGKFLAKKYGSSDLYIWFKESNISIDDRILEIGCGDGILLKRLADLGFDNLTGIDPYILENKTYNNKVKILKQNIENLDDEFDFVMLHHTFEHMENPVHVLTKINHLIKLNKLVLIRIPVIDTLAWDEYKINWVQLDPPRHFFLHSIESIKYLADRTGFKINKIIFDSTAFQFWGSEQCKNDIPLNSENSYFINPAKSIFKSEVVRQYERRAEMLNESRQGDQAAFYLEKV
jgi:SAM-dependent methyltransferase